MITMQNTGIMIYQDTVEIKFLLEIWEFCTYHMQMCCSDMIVYYKKMQILRNKIECAVYLVKK